MHNLVRINGTQSSAFERERILQGLPDSERKPSRWLVHIGSMTVWLGAMGPENAGAERECRWQILGRSGKLVY